MLSSGVLLFSLKRKLVAASSRRLGAVVTALKRDDRRG